ncbi:MAG: hypothetical protein IJS00_06935 [Paludibacteraceae bacterium]|nr:hypothetical protein [Paludibacteraceae bacterium]
MRRSKCKHIIFLFFLLLTVANNIVSQTANTAAPQKMVFLEHSKTLSFDQKRLPDAQILKGDVRFRHDSALMFCDSAYFYEKSNSVTAFGHVRFEQGDTLHGYGDRLYYDGNTRLARLCQNVKLIHKTTTLTTDSLNYDRQQDKAYYFTGGVIRDSVNSLESVWGEYNPPTSLAVFKYKVHLQNPSFTLDADTLKYNTQTHIAFLVCPTEIVYNDETMIHSTDGWYNTELQQSMLLQRSVIQHTDGKFLIGDTIFYDRFKGRGQLFSHIEVRDTVQHLSLYGNYGEMWDREKRGFVTDSALVEDWSKPEHTYAHADSLCFEELPCLDSTCHDTVFQQLRAFRNVRGWSLDYQLVCDSLTYNSRDSLIQLHQNPICWSQDQQISADTITLYFRDGAMDYAHGVGNAIGIKQEKDNHYNQLTGKEMFAYIRDNEIKQVDVIGNAETVFFPLDDDKDIIGVNKTQSSKVQIFLKDRQIDHILFTTATTGTMYPLDQIAKKETFLPMFFWAEQERPTSVDDLFLTPQRTTRPKTTVLSASDDDDEKDKKTTDKQKTKRNKKRK